MTTWPTTLPLPLIDASGNPQNPTIASPVDSAFISRRQRFHAATKSMAVSWCLTLSQMDSFETFFIDDIDNGAAAFAIDLRYPKASDVQEWVVRFIGGYTQTFEDGLWRVEAQLEMVRGELVQAAPLLGYANFFVRHPRHRNNIAFDRNLRTADNFIFNVRED